jgi:hypothetical protein
MKIVAIFSAAELIQLRATADFFFTVGVRLG